MYLYGKNSVAERININPKSIKQIYIQDNLDQPYLVDSAKAAGIAVIKVSRKELFNMKRSENLQGIIAEVERFQYTSFNDLMSDKKNLLSLIFLDRIHDPQNLGAIIRTAACFGGFAVIIPKHEACEVTDTVLRVASGGENYVPIVQASNLSQTLLKAKENDYWIAGTVMTKGQDITKIELPFPLGIVMGSEGEGIRYGVEKHLDIRVSIPMGGAPLSFNVTIATALFCYEAMRQRKK